MATTVTCRNCGKKLKAPDGATAWRRRLEMGSTLLGLLW